ncbi:MAG TPA: porin [Bacteroidales bacterium]|nr:porin [Bacteroidales bacterium]
MKRFLSIQFLLIIIFSVFANEADSLVNYTPNIEGTIRGKYEYNSSLDAHRFQVRNARFSVNGDISKIASYKAEIDLSDEGVTKMLDAYVRLKPTNWFNFTIGQQKIPFGTDNLRAPHQLYFANRSFVGKQLVSGLRDVGATALFKSKNIVPVEFQMGIYNGDGLYNQQRWQKTMNYAFRLEVFPVKIWEISLNYNSIQPAALRINYFDVGSYIDIQNLHLEGEYIYKIYTGDVFPATHSYSIFAAYNIWLNKKNLKKITPLARFDSMTDNNKGKVNDENDYAVDDIARKRITTGLTFSLNKPFINDIRLNYEKYFYADNVVNNDDKVVVEFVVRF